MIICAPGFCSTGVHKRKVPLYLVTIVLNAVSISTSLVVIKVKAYMMILSGDNFFQQLGCVVTQNLLGFSSVYLPKWCLTSVLSGTANPSKQCLTTVDTAHVSFGTEALLP